MGQKKKSILTNRERKALGLNIANPEGVRADLARRASGAALPHDSRPRRTRTRSTAKARALREQE